MRATIGNQRFLGLHFEILSNDVLGVMAPFVRSFAPSGCYILFVLDEGVSFVGRCVAIE